MNHQKRCSAKSLFPILLLSLAFLFQYHRGSTWSYLQPSSIYTTKEIAIGNSTTVGQRQTNNTSNNINVSDVSHTFHADADQPSQVKPSKSNLQTSNSTEQLAQLHLPDRQLPPPEPLHQIEFCAEKCRYVPKMCSENLYRDHLSLPAPTCLNYSLTVENDIYWKSFTSKGAEGRKVYNDRNKKTVDLVLWAAERVRTHQPHLRTSGVTDNSTHGGIGPNDIDDINGIHGGNHTTPCEQVPTQHSSPMMWPEEFEFITKVLANAQPRTYLEWGCGMSTSFYPLLASDKVIAIDGYPPWCKKVESEPRVQCMVREGKLNFYCPELLGGDGVTKIVLKDMGKLDKSLSDNDVESAMSIYVESIDSALEKNNMGNITHPFDVALVDGRFRLQCALKILPYLSGTSILLMHDFWLRKAYHKVLDYYYVIGYARSAVALKKRDDLNLTREEEMEVYKQFMNRKSVSKHDIG